LQIALAPWALPLELPAPLLLLPLPLPPPELQAASASVAAVPTAAATDRVDLRIVAPFRGGERGAHRREDDCLRREHIDTRAGEPARVGR
jgi:hypothetical protein